jgi:hypothetical protein
MGLFRSHRPTTAPEVAAATCFTIDPEVRVTDASADGCVVLHAGTARVWILNGSGTTIWGCLSAGLSLETAVTACAMGAERSQDQVRSDVVTFARALVAAGLLHPRRAAS